MRKVSLLISIMLMMSAMNVVKATELNVNQTSSESNQAVSELNHAVTAAPEVQAAPLSVQENRPLATQLTPLPTKAEQRTDGASSDDIKQLIMGLVSVIILIFILYFFVRKMPGMKVLGNPHMKVVSVMNVGVKEKIALIQVGERVFLLGITAHNISYLHEFVTADVLFAQTQSADANVTFQKMMQKIFERRPS